MDYYWPFKIPLVWGGGGGGGGQRYSSPFFIIAKRKNLNYMNRLDLSIEIPSDFVILLKYIDQINCYTSVLNIGLIFICK
jgi:hypothetical protein